MTQKPKDISTAFGAHYTATFKLHGATHKGLDWGDDPADHQLRLDRMLAITELGSKASCSLIDVGCGFGSLLERANDLRKTFEYTGIDVSDAMIGEARRRHPNANWIVGDILELPAQKTYDYAVCNGILTQKLTASQSEMDTFLKTVVARMFAITKIGIAFNVMTTHVNFMAENLYYRNPTELLGWCMTELSPRVRLDHAYPLFEYTIYLYHPDAPGLGYGDHRGGNQP